MAPSTRDNNNRTVCIHHFPLKFKQKPTSKTQIRKPKSKQTHLPTLTSQARPFASQLARPEYLPFEPVSRFPPCFQCPYLPQTKHALARAQNAASKKVLNCLFRQNSNRQPRYTHETIRIFLTIIPPTVQRRSIIDQFVLL